MSSVLNALSFNTVEGVVLDYDATYTKQIDSLNNKYLFLRGKVRYGFASEKVHGSVNGNIPLNDFNLGFNVGSDVLDINNLNPFGKKDNAIYSLLEQQNYEKFYDKQFASDFAFATDCRRLAGQCYPTELSNRRRLSNTL